MIPLSRAFAQSILVLFLIYLIDKKYCRAYEIMDVNMDFVNFTTDDVDWDSIK